MHEALIATGQETNIFQNSENISQKDGLKEFNMKLLQQSMVSKELIGKLSQKLDKLEAENSVLKKEN